MSFWSSNYLLTYDSYVPLYNRFHRGEWITRVSGGEGALDTPGPLNGTSEASAIWAQEFFIRANAESTDEILYRQWTNNPFLVMGVVMVVVVEAVSVVWWG